MNKKKTEKCLYLSELGGAGVTELEHSCAFRSSFGVCFFNFSQLMTWTKTDAHIQWFLNQTEILQVKNRSRDWAISLLNFECLQEAFSYAVYM